MRQALDQRANVAARLVELDSPAEREERKAAIQRAQSKFDAAKAQSEKLKTAEAALKLVRERRNAAERDSKRLLKLGKRQPFCNEM